MKKCLYFIEIVIFIVGFQLLDAAETSVDSCMIGVTSNASSQVGGRWRTAEGTLNVLFVLAQFPDDSFSVNNTTWPKGSAPTYMNDLVDTSWTGTPTPGSITDYFAQMSFNKLKFIGKTVSVTAPHSRQWYLDNNKKRWYIHKEIVEELDATWDFAEFDNWKYISDYNHSNTPDGVVDMVLFIWRNISNEFPNPKNVKGQLNFEHYGDMGYKDNIYVDNNQRRLKTKTIDGSGVTIINGYSKNIAYRLSIHEFAHHLLGYNDMHTGFGFWGMLSDFGTRCYVANAYERHRLGWINVIDVNNATQTLQKVTLGDYVTTGEAYRIEVDASSHKYFYLENHQRISSWDIPDQDGASGLYVLRQNGALGSNIDIVPADGRYQWSVAGFVDNPSSGSSVTRLPVFKRGVADPLYGYADTDKIPYVDENGKNKILQIEFYKDNNDNTVQKALYKGDAKDQFDLARNVFTPWSNSNSQISQNNATGFGFEVKDVVNGVDTLDLFVNTAENAAPAQPQNFIGATSSNGNPSLSWSANSEPDFSRYELWRSTTELSGYGKIADITNIATTSYQDTNCPSSLPEGKAFYKLRAVDSQNKTSVFTAVETIDVSPDMVQNFNISTASFGSTSRPKLTWTLNTENDMAGYQIERKIGSGNWTIPMNGNVSSSTSEFVDMEIVIGQHFNGQTASYRIRAYDLANLYSDYSPIRSINFNIMFEVGNRPIAKTIKNYNFYSNYPNPFNPSTEIAFDVPELSDVILEVYSLSGEKIASLIHGFKEKGSYRVTFDGANLASGIYINRFSALGQKSGKRFNAVKRMLLIK